MAATLGRNHPSLENDFVISRQDDFLRIYLNKKITGSFPNLSTNINSYNDIYLYAEDMKKYKRVLIDKDFLYSHDSINYLFSNFYNSDNILNNHIKSYAMINDLYQILINQVINDRLVVMETNKFVVYELKN